MALVYEKLRLHVTNELFIIEASDTHISNDSNLVIDRINGDIKLEKNDARHIPPTVQGSKVGNQLTII